MQFIIKVAYGLLDCSFALIEMFTAWHEIYHLIFDKVSFDYFIETDNILEERNSGIILLLIDFKDNIKWRKVRRKKYIKR